ncbi:MAG: hypothetical protein M3R36_00295 [Bacteroidota bacterium]|nr:hypothetical protein [Bacteroidota bacterium]
MKEAACSSCEIEVLNINEDDDALKRSRLYSIKSLPSVVIDGILAKCCSNSGIDMKILKSMGLGVQS